MVLKHGGYVDDFNVVIAIFNPRSGNCFSRSRYFESEYLDMSLYIFPCLRSVYDNPQKILSIYRFPENTIGSPCNYNCSDTDDLTSDSSVFGIIMCDKAIEMLSDMSGKVIHRLFSSDIKIFDECKIKDWFSTEDHDHSLDDSSDSDSDTLPINHKTTVDKSIYEIF
jgi:hypothetical protein